MVFCVVVAGSRYYYAMLKERALEALNADLRNDAIYKLEAFINAVEAQRNNKISNGQTAYLVAEAQRIIELLRE